MPRPKVLDPTLLKAIEAVFREHGFEGATLSLLSGATGLQRASLYHRFPGGKEEMAMAILETVHQQFGGHILAPLAESGALEGRLRKVAKRLAEFYTDGQQACLLETLSMGAVPEPRRAALRASFEACTDALACAAREAGATRAQAAKRATGVLVDLQGALIVSRVLDDPKPFLDVMRALPGAIAPIS